jgi:predicted phosphodiesterase
MHIKTLNDPILMRSKNIAACVYSSLASASHVFIVLSGDVAFSGSVDQYDLADKFLRSIHDAIQQEKSIPVSFIIVPGNHDCDFSQDSSVRKILVKNVVDTNGHEVDTSVIETCTAVQKPFFEFRKTLEGDSSADDDLLWRSRNFEIEGKTLRFECLNVSWASTLSETQGRLYFPIDRYSCKKTNDVDVRILVLHHPLNWFSQSIYRPFKSFIHQISDVIISGHEHMGNVGIIDEVESGKSSFIEGCVLHNEKDLKDSSFNLAVINFNKKQFITTRYNWDGSRYNVKEEGTWSDYHELPLKKTNPFTISEFFQKDVLDDPGAFFKHPGRSNITLSDIFIYPDLRQKNNIDESHRIIVNSVKLLTPEMTASGILIEGEEKAGCTSLLYQLYRKYHEGGFIPLLLRGTYLRKANETEIEALIKREIGIQYGKDQITAFDQLPSSQKLLLLDDFDDGPLKAVDARICILSVLKKRFGHLVVTVNAMFEMREMLDGDKSRVLASLEHYQIQPFGYARRSELIERWYSLDNDGTVDEATFLARCDQAERLMNVVMTKTVIPSVPLYLLTLLQSLEAGRSGDFKDSALGYYYQYLLTEAFQNAGAKPDKLTELFHYAAHLAAEFYIKKMHELSESELRDFNTRFSKKWHTVDFKPRIDMLINARVLRRVGEDYAFRYPYIYYYLKGQYLSENLHDITTRAYIGHCCQHLYVRDNANTVLFLAHHTNDDYVINKIAEALHGLFQNCSPVKFNGDTIGIQNLIEDAPKLSYSGESPEQYRKRKRDIQDNYDDGYDGLMEREEESEVLSLIAQITMLLKATEILGQVLKNQYAKIRRKRKCVLLEELFNGPLRALRDFYNYCEKNPDSLVAEIDAVIKRKGAVVDEEKHKNIARKVVASIVQMLSFAFLLHAAQGANSDSLNEDVQSVVKINGTLAFKLIDLFIHLDSPKAIPRQKLKQLWKESEKELIAARLIRIMVLHRLYMFKTTEQDMQWLSEKLKIDIKKQHSITYVESKQRLIK